MDWEQIKNRLDQLLLEGRHGLLRGALMMLNPVDIAGYMKDLDREKLLLLFRILPKDVSADVFSYMDQDQRQTLVESIADAEISALIDEMFVDDAVDFLEELPANAVKRVLQNTDPHTRNIINQFLSGKLCWIPDDHRVLRGHPRDVGAGRPQIHQGNRG